MTGADAAFDVLSDPVRLPEYVPTLRLEDSIAIEGEADPDADLAERDGAPAASFVADRKTRTITWARPERDYAGSITISQRTTEHLGHRGDAAYRGRHGCRGGLRRCSMTRSAGSGGC